MGQTPKFTERPLVYIAHHCLMVLVLTYWFAYATTNAIKSPYLHWKAKRQLKKVGIDHLVDL